MEEQYKKTFDQMVDSLKMYQRYELKDKNRKDILDKVYVDPIENDGILNLCLKDNTTVLISQLDTELAADHDRSTVSLLYKNVIFSGIFAVSRRCWLFSWQTVGDTFSCRPCALMVFGLVSFQYLFCDRSPRLHTFLEIRANNSMDKTMSFGKMYGQ